MARYIPIGQPTNRSEADSIRALRDSLPEHYTVIGNFELQLPHRANTFEYDAVVIGEYGLYAVEIKGWNGKIRGDTRRWHLDWGRVQNPLILTERKAKALRGFVSAKMNVPDELFCQAVIVLPEGAEVMVTDPRADRIVTHDRLYDFFVNEDRIREFGPGLLLDDHLRNSIETLLVPLATPASQMPRIPNYEVLGEYDDNNLPYREFVARHQLLRSRGRVRIKEYSLDTLLRPEEQRRQYERVLRDMEALTALDSNPYIASAYEMIRDQEDELNFFLVSEWVGSQSLGDLIAQGRGAIEDPDQLALHLLHAVQFMHERGIVHRNLHPEVIYMTADNEHVPLKITDFDYAQILQLPSIDARLDQMATEGYAAPELWRTENGECDHRVDVFSVGAIIFEILSGRRLYEAPTDMLHHETTWLRRRVDVQSPAWREILDDLLVADPKIRPSDLSETIARGVAACSDHAS